MRSRIDASFRALRRPAAGKLAAWAKLELEMVHYDVRGGAVTRKARVLAERIGISKRTLFR